MHERERSSNDQPAHPSRRQEAPDPVATEPDTGAIAFPVFADAPFLTWYHRHLRYSLCRQLHPTATPVILLWDESEENLLLETSS